MATEHLDKSTVLFLKDFDYDLVILDLDDKTVEELKRRISRASNYKCHS